MDYEKILEMLDESPEAAGEAIASLIQEYKPCIYRIGNELLDIYKYFVNNDEVYKLEANKARKSYEAFLDYGFSEEQAMQLVIASFRSIVNDLKNISSNIKK